MKTNEEPACQEEDMNELFEAMKKAKKAFDKHFEDEGLEGAYFLIEIRGFLLDSEFKKWKELVMKEAV